MPLAPTVMTDRTWGRCRRRCSIVADTEVTISPGVATIPIAVSRAANSARVDIELFVA